MRYRIIFALAIAVSSPAWAGQGSIGNSQMVIVWRSPQAYDEALAHIRANVAPGLLGDLIACTVPPRSKVEITRMGEITHDITVIQGPASGCQGTIPASDLNGE